MSPPIWKPHGYTSLSPYLIVAGAADFIEFARAAFDATPLRRYDLPDGSIMHAEVKLDDSVLMVGDASDKYPAVPTVLHLYVPDVVARWPPAPPRSIARPRGRASPTGAAR
jgi:PhnB protein